MPCDAFDALGMQVDLNLFCMSLKAERYAQAALEAAGVDWCPSTMMLRVLVRLQFAAQCVVDGQRWLRPCWRAARACFRVRSAAVRVTSAVREGLRAFASRLLAEPSPCVPLVLSLAVRVAPGAPASYADASGEVRFAAWTVRAGCLYILHGEWTAPQRNLHITSLELLASTFGLVALSPLLGDRVVSFTDNVATAAPMRDGIISDCHGRAWLLDLRTAWLVEADVVDTVARITSRNNLWADMGSRGDALGVERMAVALGLRVCRVAVPHERRDLVCYPVAATC